MTHETNKSHRHPLSFSITQGAVLLIEFSVGAQVSSAIHTLANLRSCPTQVITPPEAMPRTDLGQSMMPIDFGPSDGGDNVSACVCVGTDYSYLCSKQPATIS